jgi:hypothetical protein
MIGIVNLPLKNKSYGKKKRSRVYQPATISAPTALSLM